MGDAVHSARMAVRIAGKGLLTALGYYSDNDALCFKHALALRVPLRETLRRMALLNVEIVILSLSQREGLSRQHVSTVAQSESER